MRIPGLITAALAAALVLPSAAAADVALLPSLSATAGKVKQYTMGLSAGQGSADVYLSRSKRGSTQTHTLFTTSTSAVTYSAKTDLSSAKIAVSYGSHGRIAMKFTATGKKRKQLPKGCTGRGGLARKGVLKGTLKLKLDKRYFRTVKKTRISATLSEPGAFTCGPGGGFGGGGLHSTALSVSASRASQLSAEFTRFGSHAKVFEDVSVSSTGHGWSFSHNIIVPAAKTSSIFMAKNLNKGHVKGAGPFLGGTANFKASGPHTGTSAFGHVTGSFVAKFDSIGKKRFSSKQRADASQR